MYNNSVPALMSKNVGNTLANYSTWNGIIFNVKLYGAKGNGVADDTAAINAALAAIKTNRGGQLYFPPGVYVVSSKIQVLQGDSINISIKGAGGWCTVIKRAASYPDGDIFSIDAANGIGASVLIEDFRIENSSGFNNTGGYGIHIKNYTFPVHINRVYVQDGNGGFWIDNSALVMMNNSMYQKSDATYPSFAGLFVSGHSNTNFISVCDFFGQIVESPNNLTYGVLIRGCDGIQISNCAMNGKRGLAVEGGFGSNIDDVYLSICVIDNVSTVGVSIDGINAPNVFGSIRLAVCHINVGNHVGAQDCVQIGGDVDDIQIIGNNIGLGTGGGINISGTTSWRGGGKRAILIESNIIMDNNLSNSANTQGVSIGSGVSGVKVIGNEIRNASASGHQKYGVVVGNNCSNIMVSNNGLTNNEIGPIFLGTGLTNVIIKDNTGVDDVIGSVASAATITLPANSIVSLTGLVTITTINGGWAGRVIRVYANDGTLILGTGGNILRGITLAQYQMVTLTMVGTNWIIG